MNEIKLSKRKNLTPLAIGFGAVVWIYAISLCVLVIWGAMTACRDSAAVLFHPLAMPWQAEFELDFSNFIRAFTDLKVTIDTGREIQLLEMFMYTLIYAIGVCIVAQFTRCACAYVCAKFSRFRFTKIMYNVVIVVMILPIIGSTASTMETYRALNLYDNLFGYIITAAGFTGQYFLIYYAAFKGVAWEYAEAAYIDGANNFLIFFRIMLPMIRGVMGGLFLLEFIGLWNSYQVNVMLLPSYPTVSYGLWVFTVDSTNAGDTTVELASSILVALPIVILYIIFHEKLLGNIAIGGLKG